MAQRLLLKKTLLKKYLTAEEQKIINSLNLDNVEIEVRHSRHYPLGEQIATLIGFYGKDKAQEGLEKSYDSEELNWLLNESTELKNILGSIVKKSRTKK